MTLEDLTGNWYYAVGKTYTGSVTNADWILEDCEEHNLFGTYTPSLADFGSVSFDEALQNNANPGFTGANSIMMIQADAVPSPPDGDGDGFTVAWGTTLPFRPVHGSSARRCRSRSRIRRIGRPWSPAVRRGSRGC
jgi:hypothetical protein